MGLISIQVSMLSKYQWSTLAKEPLTHI